MYLEKKYIILTIYNKEKIENKIKLLVVGGSQGCKSIWWMNIKNSILDLSKKYKLNSLSSNKFFRF